MTTATLSPRTYLHHLSFALLHLAQHYGPAFLSCTAAARGVMASEVVTLYITDGITWRFAVMEFDRRIGSQLTAYAAAIVEGN